jgi:hypothetical protein
MHIYFLTRGIKHERDKWVSAMQSQYFSYNVTDKITGKKQELFAQGALRPIEFWEFVCPETSMVGNMEVNNLHMMLNSLEIDRKDPSKMPHNSKMNKFGVVMRKALGLNKIPSKIPPTPTRLIAPGVWLYAWPIGWKKDEYGSLSHTPHIHQEKL